MRQAAAYLLVGGLATAIHLIVALALNSLAGVRPLWANFFAFLCAWAFSYAANWKWTFSAASPHRAAMPRFFIVSGAGFLLNQAIVYLTAIHWGWPFWAALIPVVMIVPIMGFLASKFWAFLPGVRDES